MVLTGQVTAFAIKLNVPLSDIIEIFKLKEMRETNEILKKIGKVLQQIKF